MITITDQAPASRSVDPCVTLLLNLGAPPHVVRAIAGHSDIEVTMRIYAHVSLDEMRTALSRLDDHLR